LGRPRCRLSARGLTNRDRIPDLQRRLALLPAELEDLYQHVLLKHIAPFYREQSSQIFQIFCATESIPFLSVLTLEFALEADPKLALTSAINPRKIADLDMRCSEMTDMLKTSVSASKSKEDTDQTPALKVDVAWLDDINTDENGVGEVSRSSLDAQVAHHNDSPKRKMGYSYYASRPTVHYLHCTVRDFLLPETQSILLSWTNKNFRPYESLIRGYLLHLKVAFVTR
jgi:hypothetical protein